MYLGLVEVHVIIDLVLVEVLQGLRCHIPQVAAPSGTCASSLVSHPPPGKSGHC